VTGEHVKGRQTQRLRAPSFVEKKDEEEKEEEGEEEEKEEEERRGEGRGGEERVAVCHENECARVSKCYYCGNSTKRERGSWEFACTLRGSSRH
jgi:hypothetical protein